MRRARRARSAEDKAHRLNWAIWVVSALGLLVAVVSVAQARGTDGSGPATSSTTRPRVPAGDFVALERSSGQRFATPRSASELGVPPEFGNGPAANYHCDAWEEWLPTVDAVPAYEVALVEVRAPVDAAVVITGVTVEVLEFTGLTPDATEVRCFYGGEGVEGYFATVQLSGPGPLVVSEVDDFGEMEGDLEAFAIPPDQFHVGPGRTEVIVFSPTGEPGFYEWTLTVRAIVDQQEVEQTLGSPDEPLRAWVPDPTVQVGPPQRRLGPRDLRVERDRAVRELRPRRHTLALLSADGCRPRPPLSARLPMGAR